MSHFSLNVGCGGKTFKELKGYRCVNVDVRKLENIDVRADARNLPFPNGCFEYVYASDVVEHFSAEDAPKVVEEWKRMLKNGGMIEFKLPNLRAICKAYMKKKIGAWKASWLLYGGQTYVENFHYAGYDRGSFGELVGMKEVGYEEEGFNMIVIFRK